MKSLKKTEIVSNMLIINSKAYLLRISLICNIMLETSLSEVRKIIYALLGYVKTSFIL